MKKTILSVFVLNMCLTSFADGPEKAVQESMYICDQMGGKEPQIVAPNTEGAHSITYQTQTNSGSTQSTQAMEAHANIGIGSTNAGGSTSVEVQQSKPESTTTTSGTIWFQCK